MAVRKVKAITLVLDYGLYPRHETDSTNVNYLVEAMKAGANPPPVIADSKSKRVVDGFHRINAALKLYGEDAEIQCDFRQYDSEGAMFLEAMRLNSHHGFRLSQWDKAKCLAEGMERGLSKTDVSGALSITEVKADELIRTRYARKDGEIVTLKQSSSHLAGTSMTGSQMIYNEKAGGLNQLFYVNQVILMLVNDAVDSENERLHAGLVKLSGLLESHLIVGV